MKKVLVTLILFAGALFVSAPSSFAQGAAKTGPDPSLFAMLISKKTRCTTLRSRATTSS